MVLVAFDCVNGILNRAGLQYLARYKIDNMNVYQKHNQEKNDVLDDFKLNTSEIFTKIIYKKYSMAINLNLETR